MGKAPSKVAKSFDGLQEIWECIDNLYEEWDWIKNTTHSWFRKNPRQDEYDKRAGSYADGPHSMSNGGSSTVDDGESNTFDNGPPFYTYSESGDPWADSETSMTSPTVVDDSGLNDKVAEAWRDVHTPPSHPRPASVPREGVDIWRRGVEEADLALRVAMSPVLWPTKEEIQRGRTRFCYDESYFYFGVAGVTGSGKSSLVNAFRGLVNGTKQAAPAGATETTKVAAAYPDAEPESPFVWCDMPGAGTQDIPAEDYFNREGLFVFDCIIVVWDNRLTETDIKILRESARHVIPTYIVRSKSDQHIDNIIKEKRARSKVLRDDDDTESESESEDDRDTRDKLYDEARAEYVKASRESLKTELEKARLPQKDLYLVSNDMVRELVASRSASTAASAEKKLKRAERRMIDEGKLLQHLLEEAFARKPRNPLAQEVTGGAMTFGGEALVRRAREAISSATAVVRRGVEAYK